MAKIQKRSIWKKKDSKESIKILDHGIWVLNLDSKKNYTISTEDLLNQYEEEKENVVKKVKSVEEILGRSDHNYSFPTPDRLESMFILQRDLQEVLGNKDKIYQKKVDSTFVLESTLCLIDELMEALREIPWRAWKKEQKLDIDRMKEEIIDAWHFLINLSMAAGMHPEDVWKEFVKKNEINRDRQRIK